MRILQINNFEAVGGGSDRVYQLTTRMLLDRGHQLATLACGDESFDERKLSTLLARNSYAKASPAGLLGNVWRFIYRSQSAEAIRQIVRDFRPEVAHLHIFYGQLSSAVLSELHKLGVPCVMTVHEYRMLCPVSTMYTERAGVCERCATGSVWHAITGRCNRNSLLVSTLSAAEAWVRDSFFSYASHIEHFLMVSKFCRDKHIQFIPELTDKSSVLYNFVAEGDIALAPADLDPDAPFLYCGRIAPEKGVGLLCEAFARRPKLRLRIAGGGPLVDALSSRFQSNANISFLGKLDSDRVKSELRSARFSIVPSEWYENNPMSVLESFAQGTPVLGAAIGGIPELVEPGQTGLLFPPSNLDALVSTIDLATEIAPKVRDQMGATALQMIRDRHSESNYCESLLATYERALDSRFRRSSP